MNHNNHQASNSTNSPTRISASEAGEFLQHAKGKGPRETLGSIAGKKLGLAMLQATLGCLVIMALFTVGPYLYSKHAGEASAAVKTPEPNDKADAAKNEPKTPEQPKPADKAGTATADSKKDKGAPPPKDLVDKLKENETKTGTPNIDELLDKK